MRSVRNVIRAAPYIFSLGFAFFDAHALAVKAPASKSFEINQDALYKEASERLTSYNVRLRKTSDEWRVGSLLSRIERDSVEILNSTKECLLELSSRVSGNCSSELLSSISKTRSEVINLEKMLKLLTTDSAPLTRAWLGATAAYAALSSASVSLHCVGLIDRTTIRPTATAACEEALFAEIALLEKRLSNLKRSGAKQQVSDLPSRLKTSIEGTLDQLRRLAHSLR
jgi:hypothetical protein